MPFQLLEQTPSWCFCLLAVEDLIMASAMRQVGQPNSGQFHPRYRMSLEHLGTLGLVVFGKQTNAAGERAVAVPLCLSRFGIQEARRLLGPG